MNFVGWFGEVQVVGFVDWFGGAGRLVWLVWLVDLVSLSELVGLVGLLGLVGLACLVVDASVGSCLIIVIGPLPSGDALMVSPLANFT